MKISFFVLLGLIGFSGLSQKNTIQTLQQKQSSDSVSFIATINISNATKDGIYINGYVVNIDYAKAKSLNGKKVKISGKVTVVKSIQTNPVEQGRAKDTKHIEHPYIQIMDK